ncbi:aminotransferase class V-fold PLP-dependent enzyme [Pseudomonas frederiksbergensis]|nr:aminotransferase class V-fold PLP-dependent enzyme [Pseudomonas frederiksbergensis]
MARLQATFGGSQPSTFGGGSSFFSLAIQGVILSELKLFIPGPTWIRPEIRKAGSYPEFGHRDKQAVEIISNILMNLEHIAELPAAYQATLINGSGSNAMECAVRSLVAETDRVLCICVGAFGELFQTLATGFNAHVERLDFTPGAGIDLDILKSVLDKGSFDVVTLTHNESSTGVATDIVQVCELIRMHGALAIVDGVSLFAGAPTCIAQALPAAYVTATQKCLALPPGFGIAFVNEAALAKAQTIKNRVYTLDLLRHVDMARQGQTLTTPNCTLLNQMHVQLDYIVNQEGLQARFARHRKQQNDVRAWVRARPERFRLFTEDADASPSLTSLYVDSRLDLSRTKALMREAGYLIDTGYGKLNKRLMAESGQVMMRIPHMGDISDQMLGSFLNALDNFTGDLAR